MPLPLSVLNVGKWKGESVNGKEMKGSKVWTKVTRRQGAEAFVGPDLGLFGRLHTAAGATWKFSPRTCGAQPTAARPPLAPRQATHYWTDCERFDVRRDMCAHLQPLPLPASSIGVGRLTSRDDVSCAIQIQWRVSGLSNAPSTTGLVNFSIGVLQ